MGTVGHCPAEEPAARWPMSSSIGRLDCRGSIHSQGPTSKKTLGPGIREEKIGNRVYMHGRFWLGIVGAEKHVLSSELAEMCGRAVGHTQQTACSKRQLLLPFTLHRCCCFVYFDCLFPHVQVRTEFGIRRARHCLRVALGGEGSMGGP